MGARMCRNQDSCAVAPSSSSITTTASPITSMPPSGLSLADLTLLRPCSRVAFESLDNCCGSTPNCSIQWAVDNALSLSQMSTESSLESDWNTVRSDCGGEAEEDATASGISTLSAASSSSSSNMDSGDSESTVSASFYSNASLRPSFGLVDASSVPFNTATAFLAPRRSLSDSAAILTFQEKRKEQLRRKLSIDDNTSVQSNQPHSILKQPASPSSSSKCVHFKPTATLYEFYVDEAPCLSARR